jgi:hypothetical protein
LAASLPVMQEPTPAIMSEPSSTADGQRIARAVRRLPSTTIVASSSLSQMQASNSAPCSPRLPAYRPALRLPSLTGEPFRLRPEPSGTLWPSCGSASGWQWHDERRNVIAGHRGRTTSAAIPTASGRGEWQAGFRPLGDAWADTTTAHGRLILTVLGGLAEFERELIRARAVANGVKMGRKPKLTPHQKREAIRRRDKGEESLADIGRSFSGAPC